MTPFRPLARRWTTAPWSDRLAALVTVAAFVALFAPSFATLAHDWWSDPEAGHGLLLFPLALIFVWRRGRAADAAPQPIAGLVVLAGAVLLRYLAGLAAELFTMRVSMLAAACGLVVWAAGFRQLRHWWLPLALLALSIPLPAVVLGSIALPLQFQASRLGAALLELRHVPVLLAGNIIHLPGRSLFVTEACSGLRSLTALLSLGVLTGGLWLGTVWTRAVLVLVAIPVAIALNGVRVFLTGFLAYYVSPAAADGFLHYTEGWAIFVIAFGILGGVTWGLAQLEGAWRRA